MRQNRNPQLAGAKVLFGFVVVALVVITLVINLSGAKFSSGTKNKGTEHFFPVVAPTMRYGKTRADHDHGKDSKPRGRITTPPSNMDDLPSVGAPDSNAGPLPQSNQTAPANLSTFAPTDDPEVVFPEVDFLKLEALPRIAVISLNFQGQNETASGKKSSWMHRMSYNNKAGYCSKWGYDLIIEDGTMVNTTRDVAWSKIPILRKWLPKYQWLMWVDMDAFFMRFDLPLTTLISSRHDLVMTRDWHGLNLGIFLIKNTNWSYELLDLMWRSPPKWWVPWEEQSALIALVDPHRTGRLSDRILRRINFLPQRDINSYGAEFAYHHFSATYHPGDRMVHFPNCKGIQTCQSTVEMFYKRNVVETNLLEYDVIPSFKRPKR